MRALTSPETPEAESREDRALIREIRGGSKTAFTRLISRYQKRIFQLAYGFFRDRDDAMEIVQETFLRVYGKLDQFDETDETAVFRNWLYRIAYNLCIDYHRKFKKQKAEPEELYRYDEETRNDGTRPEDRLDLERFRGSLKISVMQLSESQRRVFVLKHYGRFKHQEIAVMLKLSVGTVKSLYHRSIGNLRKYLVPNRETAVTGRAN